MIWGLKLTIADCGPGQLVIVNMGKVHQGIQLNIRVQAEAQYMLGDITGQ